jgi:hypothetical protein
MIGICQNQIYCFLKKRKRRTETQNQKKNNPSKASQLSTKKHHRLVDSENLSNNEIQQYQLRLETNY